MAYTDDCEVDYVNYYSNPDVVVLGRPTGTAIENCARRIRNTMVRTPPGSHLAPIMLSLGKPLVL